MYLIGQSNLNAQNEKHDKKLGKMLCMHFYNMSDSGKKEVQLGLIDMWLCIFKSQ